VRFRESFGEASFGGGVEHLEGEGRVYMNGVSSSSGKRDEEERGREGGLELTFSRTLAPSGPAREGKGKQVDQLQE